MEKYYNVLKESPLFFGMDTNGLTSMLKCLNARLTDYKKDNFIFLAGDLATKVGVICRGTVQVIKEDVFGNRAILARLEESDLFGETFACAGIDVLPVSVTALTDCEILMIDYRKIIDSCPTTCPHHSKIIENMLGILAQKNLVLNQKIEFLSSRTTREKLISYLSSEAKKARSLSFTIPFDRQTLADYLSVDRSAMSSELGRMRDEGILTFNKNHFQLLKNQ